MGEVAHEHVWLHYYLCEGDDLWPYKVWDDPHYPIPEHFGSGYECVCGATPQEVAP